MRNQKNTKTSSKNKMSSKSATSRKPAKKSAPISKVASKTKRPTSQSDMVRSHLVSKGSINTVDAVSKYGVYRLSAVIYNLRDNGMNIKTGNHEFKNKNGNKSTVAKYTLVG